MKMTDRLLVTALIFSGIITQSALADHPPGGASVPPLLPPPTLSDVSPVATQTTPTVAPIEMGVTEAKPAATPAKKVATSKKKTAAKPVAKKVAAKIAKPVSVKSKYPEISVPLKPGAAVVAVKTRVNVRGAASTQSEVITRLTNGEPVTVIQEIVRENRKPDEPTVWAKIALPAGSHGWVHGQFVDSTNKTVTSKKLNVRGGPGENYSVLATLQKGDVITQLKEKQGWLQIEPPTNAVAYVAAAYLKQEVAVVPEITPVPMETTTVAQTETMGGAAGEAPTNTIVNPAVPTPTPTPAPEPALAASPAMPSPEIPMILDPSIKRVVEREGVVRRTWSIQAPTHFQLVSPQTSEKIVYLHTDSTNLDLGRYKGLHIIATGEEGLDKRWKETPVLTIRRIQVVE